MIGGVSVGPASTGSSIHNLVSSKELHNPVDPDLGQDYSGVPDKGRMSDSSFNSEPNDGGPAD